MDGSLSNVEDPAGPKRFHAVWRLLRPYLVGLTVLFVCLLVQMGFYAALPVSFSEIIDSALPNDDWQQMRTIFALLGTGRLRLSSPEWFKTV